MIQLINGISGGWAEYFGFAVLQNTIFLAALFILMRFSRRAPASVRYWLGCVGIIKLLLPPFVPSGALMSVSEPLAGVSGGTFALRFAEAAGVPAGSVAYAEPSLNVMSVVFLIWALFATGYIVTWGSATIRLLHLLRGAVPIEGSGPADYALRRGVRVYRTGRISVPLTVGFLPRRIYVPANWERWTEACRMAAVRHELAHIERRDSVLQALQVFVQAIYFFHPLVLLLNRRMGELREMACDDASIAPESGSYIEYSRCLVEIAEKIEFDPFAYESASTLMKRKRELLSRVKYQMKGGHMRSESRRRIAATLAILVLLVVPLSWYKGGAIAKGPAVGSPGAPVPVAGKDLKSMTLALHGDKMIKVGETEVPLEELVALLDEEIAGDRDKLVVKLECEKSVSMKMIYDVQKLLTGMDLRKVEFRGSGYQDMAVVLPPANVDDWLGKLADKDIIRLIVDEEGHALIKGEKIPHAKLQRAIEDHLAMNPHVVFTLESSTETTYGAFLEALEKLKGAGAPRIVIMPPGE